MRLYKLFVRECAGEQQAWATVSTGPFLVEATDEWTARRLVGINYGVAANVSAPEKIPPTIWCNPRAAECREVAQDRSHVEARDKDIDPPRFLVQRELRLHFDQVARMIWWPLRPGELCPV